MFETKRFAVGITSLQKMLPTGTFVVYGTYSKPWSCI